MPTCLELCGFVIGIDRMDEKTETGGDGSGASELGSSSVVSQDKGSENNGKIDDPSLENPVNVPLSTSEITPEKCLNLLAKVLELGSTRASVRADSEHADRDDPYSKALFNVLYKFDDVAKTIDECENRRSDDPSLSDIFQIFLSKAASKEVSGPIDWNNQFICTLEELLESSMHGIFRDAIKRIVECGYNEDVSEKAISSCGLYHGGKDLVSNVVKVALASLDEGEGGETSSDVFENLKQLEKYTIVEMIGLLREGNPSLSVPEATWWLLLFDLNVLMAWELEGDIFRNVDCNEVSRESSSGSKPALPCSKDRLPETTPELGSSVDKHPVTSEALTPEKDGLVSFSASGNNVPVASIPKGKARTGQKWYSKTGPAALGPKSFTSRKAVLPTNVTNCAVPITNTGPSSLSLENKAVPKSSKTPDRGAEKKPAPKAESTDYLAGIPYDKSSGKYIPQGGKDEIILKLLSRLHELKNDLDSWTQWTAQKVKETVHVCSKDYAELKSLRQEKDEAEEQKKTIKRKEEETMKSLNDTTRKAEDADSKVLKLEVENSVLKEIAKNMKAESALRSQEAFEMVLKAYKDVDSRNAQERLIREELASEKQKAAELQRKVDEAKRNNDQTKMLREQEMTTKEKLLAQATSIRKDRECLVSAAEEEEDAIKLKADKDKQKYVEEIEKLKNKLSKLKMKQDSSKIAELRRGIDGGQCSSVNKGNHSPVSSERECVVCLSEERRVVFIPCAHQVLCVKCNDRHRKEGMRNCPFCNAVIMNRICADFLSQQ